MRAGYIRLGQFKPRVDEDGIHCLNCDTVLSGRRRRYCSDKCSSEFWTKHNWGALRDKKVIDSNFTCCKCGFHIDVKMSPSGKYEFKYREATSQFVVDHIVPLFEGGEEFNEENLQVLCKKKCNKRKTKIDMKRYYQQRRVGKLGKFVKDFWNLIEYQKSQETLSKWILEK